MLLGENIISWQKGCSTKGWIETQLQYTWKYTINKHLNGNWGQSFTPVFMSNICQLNRLRPLYKGLWWFHQISRSFKVTKFCIQRMWRHTRDCMKHITPSFLCIFVTFMEKRPPIIKFDGVFDHFSRTCEAAKSWTLKLCLCVSDVIHAKEQTKFANCGLHVNFWNFL